MKVICAVCKKVLKHKAPYEDHRESHTYCGHCFDLMLLYNFDYYIEYKDGKATIKPHLVPLRRKL